jgi:hypothetical protein
MVITPGTGTLSVASTEATLSLALPAPAARVDRVAIVNAPVRLGRRGQDAVSSTGPPALVTLLLLEAEAVRERGRPAFSLGAR